jgi:hypothetical protein
MTFKRVALFWAVAAFLCIVAGLQYNKHSAAEREKLAELAVRDYARHSIGAAPAKVFPIEGGELRFTYDAGKPAIILQGRGYDGAWYQLARWEAGR